MAAKIGHSVSKETRRKISKKLMGHCVPMKQRLQQSIAMQGRKDTPARYKKRIEVWTPAKRREQSLRLIGRPSKLKGRKLSEEHRRKVGLARKGYVYTKKERDKLSKMWKKRWEDPEFAAHRIKQMHSGIDKGHTRLNKTESALNNILQRACPGEYKFVGNAKFWIEMFNPDFINCNGQKKIIEVFGNYWHNKKDVKIRDKRRLKAYKKYGYDTLVLWEKEIYSKGVEEKIKVFHNGGAYEKDNANIHGITAS